MKLFKRKQSVIDSAFFKEFENLRTSLLLREKDLNLH